MRGQKKAFSYIFIFNKKKKKDVLTIQFPTTPVRLIPEIFSVKNYFKFNEKKILKNIQIQRNMYLHLSLSLSLKYKNEKILECGFILFYNKYSNCQMLIYKKKNFFV